MKQSLALLVIALATFTTGCNKQSVENGQSVAVDDNNFTEVVLQSDKPVLVDFTAKW